MHSSLCGTHAIMLLCCRSSNRGLSRPVYTSVCQIGPCENQQTLLLAVESLHQMVREEVIHFLLMDCWLCINRWHHLVDTSFQQIAVSWFSCHCFILYRRTNLKNTGCYIPGMMIAVSTVSHLTCHMTKTFFSPLQLKAPLFGLCPISDLGCYIHMPVCLEN